MDNDRILGAIDEFMGIAKQKAGEVIGNCQLQVEGIVQQAQGKVESASGEARDAIREANREAPEQHDRRYK